MPRQDGIQVDLDFYGLAPLWATGPGVPNDHQKHYNWEPSANDFKQFVHAVGERYSGNFDPITNSVSPGNPDDLPRVGFWSIWNEPNLGFMLAPQGVPGNLQIENSGRMYRALLNAAWTSLQQTGHGRDTILIGELAPRGTTTFGVFAAMKPLVFLRALYCVDSRYSEAARSRCRRPRLPDHGRRFAALPRREPRAVQCERVRAAPVDALVSPQQRPRGRPGLHIAPAGRRAWSELSTACSEPTARVSASRFTTRNSATSRPRRTVLHFPSPATAALYLNWAEYISWRDSRVESFAQYQLRDPVPTKTDDGGWATGLLTTRGVEKPTYSAWRLPLYLPATSASRRRNLELWGCVRPARFAILDTGRPQTARIQFKRGTRAPWTTLRTVTISNASNCYFDVHLRLPGSGTVRLSYTYPANDPLLTPNDGTAYSRSVRVTLH